MRSAYKKYEYWRPTDDRPQGPFTHFEKFQMAITLQRVNRSPSCLILGWGFRYRRIEQRYFRFAKIQDAKKPTFFNSPAKSFLNRHLRDCCSKRLLFCWTNSIKSSNIIHATHFKNTWKNVSFISPTFFAEPIASKHQTLYSTHNSLQKPIDVNKVSFIFPFYW